jgi:mRNA interferase MazF
LSAYRAAQIVLVDWRDALPKEPNKLRPAVVVEDDMLFDPSFPNVIVVPLSEDHALAPPELLVPIDPTPENGCTKRCYALSSYIATTSIHRVRPTESRIMPEQLRAIRRQIAFALGLE